MPSPITDSPGLPGETAYLSAHFLRTPFLTHPAELGDRMQHLPAELAGRLVPLAARARSTIASATCGYGSLYGHAQTRALSALPGGGS